MNTEELISIIEDAIDTLSKRIVADHGKYVMANSLYVQVEDCKGIDDSNIVVRCATSSCKAVCFDTREEARRSGNYYMKNCAGQPILLVPTRAEVFFSEEISKAIEMLDFIKEITKSSIVGYPDVSNFEKTHYSPDDDCKTEKCIIIDCDKGRFRIIPIYFNLDGEEQIELQRQWYDNWVYVSTHAHVIDDVTEKLAYDIICQSTKGQLS